MFRNWFPKVALSLLAGAMLAPGTARAQMIIPMGGYYGGVSPLGGYNAYSGYNAGLFGYSGGWVDPYFFSGFTFYPGFPAAGDAARMRSSLYPALSATNPCATLITPAAYSDARPSDNRARIRLLVPDDAEVWLQGVPMQQTGQVRLFESTPLNPSKEYTYDVRVRQGSQVVRRTVDVRAGSSVVLDIRPELDVR